MYVTRRGLGQAEGEGEPASVGTSDWAFVLGTLLFGGWLLTAHWKH
jgi:hypothetical protein